MQPKFYTIDQHLIPPEKVDPHAYYLVRKLREHGFSAYIVGGWVRDLLMGKPPKDFDISTSARPEEIKALFPNAILIGKRFRLAHVRFGKKILEVSTFRTGDIQNASLILHDNDYGTEEDDVLRRDFTINGLFYDLESETIIDYVGGYIDAKNRLLRTIGEPIARFKQDPVRMLRLLKFQARFGLSVDKSTLEALSTCKKEIHKSSQARILEEILRMLESGFSARFFENLLKHEFFPLLFPAIESSSFSYCLAFLQEADLEKERKYLSRPVLLSCIIYPTFVKNLEKAAKKKVLHLNNIALVAAETIEEIFSHFFQIPRKLKGSVIYILTTQCRFTPIYESSVKKPRLPYDPNISFAIKFFHIRTKVQPELKEKYELFKQLAIKTLAKKPRRKKNYRKVPR